MPVIWQDLTPLSPKWPRVIRRFFEKGRTTHQCNGCGKIGERGWWQSTERFPDGRYVEGCQGCSSSYVPTTYDVFWDGKPEHGLADDPATGRPRVFGSKAEKAAYLKARGLTEAGDRHHGAPASVLNQQQRPETNAAAMQALKMVREMGADRRRQEFNRIMKESGRR